MTTDNSVKGFFGEYRYLSNFWLTPVEWNGHKWKSSEHAYQAAKFLGSDDKTFRAIVHVRTPGEAKVLGQAGTIREDWEDAKYGIMQEIVRAKFQVHQLAEALMSTGDAYLEESNSWRDTYWGVCDGKGENNLGKILMAVRAELQEQKNA